MPETNNSEEGESIDENTLTKGQVIEKVQDRAWTHFYLVNEDPVQLKPLSRLRDFLSEDERYLFDPNTGYNILGRFRNIIEGSEGIIKFTYITSVINKLLEEEDLSDL